MEYQTHLKSPLGTLTLASDGESITGLWMEGQKYALATLGACAKEEPGFPVFHQAEAWLSAYFGKKPLPAMPALAPRGTHFQELVWAELREIPYGQLTTYGELGRRITQKTGTRAPARTVGGGVGHNPISILIPCHRVVGADGSLTGYAGGLDRKIALLALEGVDLSRLHRPTRGTAL